MAKPGIVPITAIPPTRLWESAYGDPGPGWSAAMLTVLFGLDNRPRHHLP